MKKVRSILIFILAVVLGLTGCSGGGETTTVTTTTETVVEDGYTGEETEEVVEEEEKDKSQKDKTTKEEEKEIEKAKKELEGYTFTIASGWMTPEDQIDESTPLFERLFWEQAHKVEEEYGCDIKLINFSATSNNLKPYIMAGKKVADLVETMPTWIPANVKNGYLKSWDDVAGVDVNDTEKFNSIATDISSYKGKTYGIQFTKPVEARYCIMFNKTLLEKNGIKVSEIYKLVEKKQWTWDKLREYAKKCTKDTNGDGVNDTWGLIGKYDYIGNGLLSSYGGSLVTKKGGKYVYSLNSKASLKAMNTYVDMVNTDKSVWVADQLYSEASYSTISEDIYRQRFNNGSSAFLLWESHVLTKHTIHKANFEYGILPLPLGDGQTEYVSPSSNARVFALTTTNKDLAKATVVINALAEGFGGYQGDDWYEDIATEYFKNDVKKNVEMYKLILNSSTVDYGLAIASLENSFYEAIRHTVYQNTKTPAAAVDAIKNNHTDEINSVFN